MISGNGSSNDGNDGNNDDGSQFYRDVNHRLVRCERIKRWLSSDWNPIVEPPPPDQSRADIIRRLSDTGLMPIRSNSVIDMPPTDRPMQQVVDPVTEKLADEIVLNCLDSRRQRLLELNHKHLSFESDQFSFDSIGELLEFRRRQDPEELLFSLGFGSDLAEPLDRVPERFFAGKSRAKGIDQDLSELLRSLGNSTDTSLAEIGGWTGEFCFDEKFSILDRFTMSSVDKNNNQHPQPATVTSDSLTTPPQETECVSSQPSLSTATSLAQRRRISTAAGSGKEPSLKLRSLSTPVAPQGLDRIIAATHSILNPANRQFLESQGTADNQYERKRLVLGTRVYSFDDYGDSFAPRTPVPASPNHQDRRESVDNILSGAARSLSEQIDADPKWPNFSDQYHHRHLSPTTEIEEDPVRTPRSMHTLSPTIKITNSEGRQSPSFTDSSCQTEPWTDYEQQITEIGLNSLRLSIEIYRNQLLQLRAISGQQISNLFDNNDHYHHVDDEFETLCNQIQEKLIIIEQQLLDDQTRSANNPRLITQHIQVINELISNASNQLTRRRITLNTMVSISSLSNKQPSSNHNQHYQSDTESS